MAWNLARGDAFLPHVSQTELKRRMAAEDEAKPRLRLLIALQRKKGLSLDEISGACGLPRRTVHGTLKRLSEKGIEAAHSVRQTGRPPRLTGPQLKDLRHRLLCLPSSSGFHEGFWNTRMVLALVKREYGVGYVHEHMTRVLDKMGFSYKKPRPTNARSASAKEVADFKKKPVQRRWLPKEKDELGSSKTRAFSRSSRTRRTVGTRGASGSSSG